MASIFVLITVVLSSAVVVYYEQIHIHSMRPYPLKLTGGHTLVAAHLIVFPALYLLRLVWQYRGEFRTVFQPSANKVSWTLVVFLLTPLDNLYWLPVQFWFALPMVLFSALLGKSSIGLMGGLILCIALVAAYILVCVIRASGMRIVGSVFTIAIYLLMIFAFETLFLGITYI